METRHIVFGAVFMAVFGIGMLNVMSDGRVSHAFTSQLPGHVGEGDTSIGEVTRVTVELGETEKQIVELKNVKRISYHDPTIFANGTDPVNFTIELSPPPVSVEQSLPPNYVYDHTENTVRATLSFQADENAEPGERIFKLTGKPGNISSEEVVRRIPVEVK